MIVCTLREESAGRKRDTGTAPFGRHEQLCCARGTFYPHGWLLWNRAGAEPQTENNLCQRWRNKTWTVHWITVAGFDWCSWVQLKLPFHYWEELSWETLRYALSKQTWSRTQNFRAAEFVTLEKKCFPFRHLYCTVLKDPRVYSRYLI